MRIFFLFLLTFMCSIFYHQPSPCMQHLCYRTLQLTTQDRIDLKVLTQQLAAIPDDDNLVNGNSPHENDSDDESTETDLIIIHSEDNVNAHYLFTHFGITPDDAPRIIALLQQIHTRMKSLEDLLATTQTSLQSIEHTFDRISPLLQQQEDHESYECYQLSFANATALVEEINRLAQLYQDIAALTYTVPLVASSDGNER